MKKKSAIYKAKTLASLLFREETLLLTAAGTVFAADRLLKHAVEEDPDESFPRDVSPLVRIEKVRNYGLPLGVLREHQPLVLLLSGSALSMVAGRAAFSKGKIPFAGRLGLSLAAGGGFSNLYDRLKHGFVTDFLHFRKGPFSGVVMNLGDLAVFLGSLLSLLFRNYSDGEHGNG